MFKPVYTITPKIASLLIELEALRQSIDHLPITSKVLISLRETARLKSTHYSTYIEGNRLTQQEIFDVLFNEKHIPQKERDEKEVLGYYTALQYVESAIAKKTIITQETVKYIHALVMAGGKKKVKPSEYRDGQNVIRESQTGKIVYLPPEASDVPSLMNDLIAWIIQTRSTLPCPLQAGIVHYQFATIHPYYDGNGRTARLLTTLIMHLGGYGLKGLYSLEEYYAKDLAAYYDALTVGPSHNYYFGRAEADITLWVEYFCKGLVKSFTHVKNEALKAQQKGSQDITKELAFLDAQQKKVVQVFSQKEVFTSHDISKLLKLKPRTARALCQKWVGSGFLVVKDLSKKKRSYSFSPKVTSLIND